MINEQWFEYLILGLVLVVCFAFMIRKARSKFSTSGGSNCGGCRGCGDEKQTPAQKAMNAP